MKLFSSIGPPVANALGLGQKLIGSVTGGAAPNPVAVAQPMSFVDPTQTILGSPDQGIYSSYAPPMRRVRRRRGRRRYAPASEYQDITTGVSPQIASIAMVPPPFGTLVGTHAMASPAIDHTQPGLSPIPPNVAAEQTALYQVQQGERVNIFKALGLHAFGF